MTRPWPALDAVLATLATAPSRTGSVIVTVYGDAILPRGGVLALTDLLTLMRRLGAADGVVRTAMSRLAKDGLLQSRRLGRRSAYAVTQNGRAEFTAAIPRIYGPAAPAWDGHLHLAFPGPGCDRTPLDQAGFVLLAPGILVSPNAPPGPVPTLQAAGPPDTIRHLAARAWPLDRLAAWYRGVADLLAPLDPVPDPAPLDAMAARIVLIHAWRRVALRDPRLPAELLPPDWPGPHARARCAALYAALAPASERWLDAASDGTAPLPPARAPHRFAAEPPQT